MDANKKTSIGTIGATVVIGDVTISLILSKTPEEADLSAMHTGTATKTSKETPPATTQVQGAEKTAKSQESAASSVSAFIETYASGKISIQYPAVDQLDDISKKDKIDELLKTNALSVIGANDIDEAGDTLDIKHGAISVDRKRPITTYADTLFAKGATHSVSLLCSNTTNLL